ncbi:putative siderophore transport system ATP-binding protein YusV [Gimesia alba]|uniref:Putative siderophore transport system ATP-binding protein YusV n=1 Tax=Gimesia alba TaxID=2527973 RepID=A0A517RDN9_9PLAN|nr:ABC transporter ATP-binding protein [Gimesia alba]QDT41990.1 putative siderophore transport system ATP-binding protein YusV [Gimesia alba]
MIQLKSKSLSLRYDGDEVVRQLSLELPANQITTLIGPNGSGKSTLLKGLARLMKPTHGAAYLDGQEIHKMNTREVARRVSILTQQVDAPDGLVVRELLAYGRFPHANWLGYSSQKDLQAIDRALDIAGIAHLADRPLGELSGGQRQLAWISMTLAQDAEIMLLDEPTTFLDLAHQLEVLNVLQRLQQEHQRTIVLVLHDINQAARFSHYMVALREGEIAWQGSPAEVMTTEMLSQVFGVEAEVSNDATTHAPYCVPIRPVSRQSKSDDGDRESSHGNRSGAGGN